MGKVNSLWQDRLDDLCDDYANGKISENKFRRELRKLGLGDSADSYVDGLSPEDRGDAK